MTRHEIQQWCIDECNILINKYGDNHIYFAAPKPGKNSWTLKELLDSVVKDTIPEGLQSNLIDDIMKLVKFRKEHGLDEILKHSKGGEE